MGFDEYYYPDDFFSGYNSFNGEDMAVIGMIAIFALIVCFFALLYAAVRYVFNSIGLYTIAKNRGMDNAFLAFIPVVNSYYLGKIADDINKTMNKKSSNAVILLSLQIATLFFAFVNFIVGFASGLTGLAYGIAISSAFIGMISSAIAIAYSVFLYISLYRIYKEYSPEHAVIFEVCTVLFDLHPFFLFAIRNKKSGYQKWLEQKAAEAEENSVQADPAPVDETPAAEETTVVEETPVVEEAPATEQVPAEDAPATEE